MFSKNRKCLSNKQTGEFFKIIFHFILALVVLFLLCFILLLFYFIYTQLLIPPLTDDSDPETYNTITSLSQLTKLLPPDLLLDHISRLPSRHQRNRRLSQCPEEDEGNGTSDGPRSESQETKVAQESKRDVRQGRVPPVQERGKMIGTNPLRGEVVREVFLRRHTDRKFIDTSLVAIKSDVPKKAVTVGEGSELWVKRTVPQKKKVRTEFIFLGIWWRNCTTGFPRIRLFVPVLVDDKSPFFLSMSSLE